MKDVKEVFENELREMESSFLRRVFRIFVADYFREMIKEVEKKMNDIRLRAYYSQEVEVEEVIYQGIINDNEYIYAKDELFPYFEEDLIEKSSLESFNKGEKILDKAPMFLSYSELKMLVQKEFTGYVKSNGVKKSFIFSFEKAEEYQALEKRLKGVYKQNNLKWLAMYGPYTRKMYKVVVKDYLDSSSLIGEAEDIELDLGDYEDVFMKGYFPVWNVKREKVLSTSDSSYREEGYYEHRIEISSENKILVDLPGVEIIDIYKDRLGDIVVGAKTKNVISWDIWMVKKKLELNEYKEFRHELVDNERYDDYIGKIKKQYGRRVRTEGELHRVCKSYKALEGCEIERISYKGDTIELEVDIREGGIYLMEKKDFILDLVSSEFWECRFEVKSRYRR